jgi:hypothetical protein
LAREIWNVLYEQKKSKVFIKKRQLKKIVL